MGRAETSTTLTTRSSPRRGTWSGTARPTTCATRSFSTTTTTTTSTRWSRSRGPTAPTRVGWTGCITGTRSARRRLISPRCIQRRLSRLRIRLLWRQRRVIRSWSALLAIVRVSTHGVSYQTVGPDRRRGRGHDPLLPGQGLARLTAPGGSRDLVRRGPRREAEEDQGAPAAGLHADGDPALSRRRARGLGRGARRGRHPTRRAADPDPRRAGGAERGRGAAAAQPAEGGPTGADRRRGRAAVPGRRPRGDRRGHEADRRRGADRSSDRARQGTRGRARPHGPPGGRPVRPLRTRAHPGRRR